MAGFTILLLRIFVCFFVCIFVVLILCFVAFVRGDSSAKITDVSNETKTGDVKMDNDNSNNNNNNSEPVAMKSLSSSGVSGQSDESTQSPIESKEEFSKKVVTKEKAKTL